MLDPSTLPVVDTRSLNVLVGLPCYGGQTYVHHNRALRELEIRFKAKNIRYNIMETITESLIPRARNLFGNMCCFDKDPNGEHYTDLLFLDVDIGFHPDNILDMFAWPKDIVALPYPCKSINWGYIVEAVKRGVEEPIALSRMGSRPIVNAEKDTPPFDVTSPIQFPQLGTGLLRIQRKVFQKFAEDPKRHYLLMDGEKYQGIQRDFAYDFFQIGINPETRYYDSEDYRFCLDARKLGFETWLLPWAVTSHTGPCDFWMDWVAQAKMGIPPPDNAPAPLGFVPMTI